MLRPIHHHRSLVAILAGLLIWSATLLGTGKSVAAAADVQATATPAHVPVCTSRLDEAVLQYEQKQLRAQRASQSRLAEAERLTQDLEEQHRVAAVKHAARLEKAARQIEDLVPVEYMNLVLEVAQRYQIDPRLLASVGTVESQWYARALGTQGDSGLMQILPSTAEWIASKMGLRSYDLYDPVTNLNMGAWYLRTLYREYGDWDMALAAYNGGPRGAPRGASHPYTQLVMRVYHMQGS